MLCGTGHVYECTLTVVLPSREGCECVYHLSVPCRYCSGHGLGHVHLLSQPVPFTVEAYTPGPRVPRPSPSAEEPCPARPQVYEPGCPAALGGLRLVCTAGFQARGSRLWRPPLTAGPSAARLCGTEAAPSSCRGVPPVVVPSSLRGQPSCLFSRLGFLEEQRTW